MLDLIFSDYRPYVQDVVAWTLCCAALIWGGGPERLVAATWLVFFEIGDILYTAVFGAGRQLETIDLYFASIDVLAGMIYIGTALYANRNYTLFVAGVQLLAMIAHVSRGIIDIMSPITYAIMVIAPGWLQLLFLAIGLTRHIQRRRKHGKYRDWRFIPGRGAGSGDPGSTSFWMPSVSSSWRDNPK